MESSSWTILDFACDFYAPRFGTLMEQHGAERGLIRALLSSCVDFSTPLSCKTICKHRTARPSYIPCSLLQDPSSLRPSPNCFLFSTTGSFLPTPGLNPNARPSLQFRPPFPRLFTMWSSASGKRKAAASGLNQPSIAKRHHAASTKQPPSGIVDCRPIVTPKPPKFPSLLEASLQLSPAKPLNKSPPNEVSVRATTTVQTKKPRVLPAKFTPRSVASNSGRRGVISNRSLEALDHHQAVHRHQKLIDCRPVLTPKAPKFPSLLNASLQLSPTNPLNAFTTKDGLLES